MSCKQTAALLTEYLDNELPVLRREQLDEHLQGCPHCREELDTLRAVNAQLLRWQEQEVPRWSRLPQAGHKPALLWPVRWRWWQWTPLATAMLLVLAVLFNVQLIRDDGGFTVVFGGQPPMADNAASEQVLRPDIDARRQSMALTLAESATAETGSQPWQQGLAAVEQTLFRAVCDNSAGLQALPGESLTIVLPGLGADGGDRTQVVAKRDMQSCLSGDISAAELQERSRHDGF